MTNPPQIDPAVHSFFNLFKPSPKKYIKFPLEVLRYSSESPKKVLKKSSDSAIKD